MQHETFFYIVFLSQILLLSYYIPRKILQRIRYVFDHYPPSDYPNLYPDPIEQYERARRNFKNLNTGILLAGLSLLAVLVGYERSGEWDRPIVTLYFLAQFSPVLLLEIWTHNYYKRMRQADTRTTRTATLQPRNLFDFISPISVGIALGVYLAFIAFIFYIKQFDYPWFGGYWNIVGVTATNLFFAGIVLWNMYGKKRDPYQAYEDRIRQIELIAKQMVFTSIAATLHIALAITLASLEMREFEPTSSSLYFQFIALLAVLGLRTLRLDNVNFSVYKGDPTAEKGYAADAEQTEDGNNRFRSVGIGLGIGLLSGAALGLILGGNILGFIAGAGLGTFFGVGIAGRWNARGSLGSAGV